MTENNDALTSLESEAPAKKPRELAELEHTARNSLNVIVSAARLLEKIPDPASREQFTKKILENALKLRDELEAILAFKKQS